MNSKYNIYIYDNEKLVDYTQKMGQMKAADIIKKLQINGQEFMELSNIESVQWKLTRLEQNILKQCLAKINTTNLPPPIPKPRIRMNTSKNEAFKERLGEVLKAKLPSFNDEQKEHDADTTTNNEFSSGDSTGSLDVNKLNKSDDFLENIAKRKPHPIPRYIKRCKEYFRYKKYSKRKYTDSEECLLDSITLRMKSSEPVNSRNSRDSFYSCSSSMEMVPTKSSTLYNSRSLLSDTSSYIYPPTVQQKPENLVVERIKKYVMVDNSETVNCNLQGSSLYSDVIENSGNVFTESLQDSMDTEEKLEDINLNNDEIYYGNDKKSPVCNCGFGILKYSCIFTCQAID